MHLLRSAWTVLYPLLLLAAGSCWFSLANSLRAAEPAARPTNRLSKESSLYLLMHAHNPVDWYPWGAEALAKAKAENKLIFLSIGYSSCHWCHVMERETFTNEAIAKTLNEHFICIKVDREERPDIDSIYMTAINAINGNGGWPLSIFLTPDALPIVGGSYFPPTAKDGLPGFDKVLEAVMAKWKDDPAGMKGQGERVAGHVRDIMRQRPVILGSLGADSLTSLMQSLGEEYDAEHGGFGFSAEQPQKPKFPEPSRLEFLLDCVRRNPADRRAQNMLTRTLTKMSLGGIYDQIGGGFHRYSTDRFWRVPHFEKMLYDNGQLASVYAEAFALTGREDFARIARQTLDFMLREMISPEGCFFAAINSESDGVEGKFYLWSTGELEETLDRDELVVLTGAYGIGPEGEAEGQHILVMHKPLGEVAEERGLTELVYETQLAPLRDRLLARRALRARPVTDNKILVAWNGLAIRGLADGGRILKEERYIAAAAKAADFILTKMTTPDGRLLSSYTAGEARLNAYLDDYAFFVEGLIALHKASGERRWLEAADRLTAKQIELFGDEKAGGFFFTSHDHEALIARGKDPVDSDLPAGNSVAASNLLYLATALDKPAYRQAAEQTLRCAIPILDRSPQLVPRMAVALAEYLETEKKSK
jgi:uncharacterized protein YyaL (SSP411 family)